jgi:Integrase core domain
LSVGLNDSLRDECLSLRRFEIEAARRLVEAWRIDYNES